MLNEKYLNMLNLGILMKKFFFPVLKFLIFALVLILIFYFVNVKYGDLIKDSEGRREIIERASNFVESYGFFGPLIYILIYGLSEIILFPGTLLTFIGAVIFGIWKGTLFTVIGATLGASLAFLTAKYFGKDFVGLLLGKKLERFENLCRDYGFKAIIILRLLPAVPFNALNFISGLSRIRFIDYFLATLIGIIPGTFVYTYLFATVGERILIGEVRIGDFLSLELILPILLFVVLLVTTFFLKKIIFKKEKI